MPARPVMLVLEDLHWGDAPSVQFVDAALRTLRERPLMVMAFGRPEVDDRFPGLWADRDVQRIGLPPLTSKACQRLARQVLGQIGAERAAWIVERADGNPLFLEELLRAVASGADLKTGVPDTVIGMVQARFDALGPEAERVLRAGSVFGETFRADGVRALLGEEDASVEQWLQILAGKEVVDERPGARAREYVFRHALVRDAAYDMLTAQDRALGHRLAGGFLEQAGEREAILLVEHFERGGELPRAAHWSRLAAAQALDANDLAAAVARVERGVRCGAAGETLGAMRLVEAQARFWRGEYADAERAAREAAALTSGAARLQALSELIAAQGQQAKYGEVLEAARSVHGERPIGETINAWLGCLARAAHNLLPAGHYADTERLLAELEAHAQLLEPAARARVEDLRAKLAIHRGQQAQAVAGFEAALGGFEAAGDVRSMTELQVNLGSTFGDLGLLEQAEHHLAAALTTAERLDLRFVVAGISMNLVFVRGLLGRHDEARALGRRALALAEAQGDRRVQGGTHLYLAHAESLAGDPVASERHALAAVAALQEVAPVLPAAVAALAHALLAQGRVAEARAQAEEASRLTEALGHVEDGEGLIRVVLAECRLADGDEAGAREAVGRAQARLAERAAVIQRPEWREAFLRRLPDHARTVELAARLGLASAQQGDEPRNVLGQRVA